MTIKEAIERIRSLLGQPTQSPLYPKEEILDYLDLAILKTITSLSTFCDEYLHISLIRFRLNANENKVNLSTLEFSPQFGALVKPIFRIKSVRVNGRYAQKEDLNEIFAKMTFMPTTSGDTWYYAIQGLSILWFYPIPTQRVECEVYYIGLPTSLKTLPETTDLSTIIHPATYDSIIYYACAQGFLKIKDGNGYSLCMQHFYNSLNFLKQELMISPVKGAINPFTGRIEERK